MRKVLTVTIDAEGRDQGKQFLLTELPASRAERWAIRAFMLLGKAGADIPDDVQSMGMAGIAQVGFQALVRCDYDDLAPLFDEMFACVQFIPDPRHPGVTRALIEDDIEEVTTRLRLRKEVFELHVGFFGAAGASTSASSSTPEGGSNATQTFPQRLAR